MPVTSLMHGPVHEDPEEEEAGGGDWRLVVSLGQSSHSCRTHQLVSNRKIKVTKHLPYLPDLALADFFLIPRLKIELAYVKKGWDGAVRSIVVADFAKSFRPWL
jgi:hypothetical protein